MNVPNLRFPEFKDEWKESSLGDEFDFSGGGTPSTKVSKFWTGNIPWISSSILKDDSIELNTENAKKITVSAIEQSATKLIKKNSILIVSRVGVGKVALTKSEICTSQDFTNLNSSEHNHYFSTYYIKNKMNKIVNSLQGTSIKGITNGEIKKINFTFPTILEQEKIGFFLRIIDKKIMLQMKIIEEYRLFKKAIISAVLPNTTSNLPNYRSKEFSDVWTEYKVSDIFTITRGNVLSSNDTSKIMDDNNIYPVYSSQTLNSGLLGYYNSYLYENAITWTTDGANAGTVAFRKGKFYCTNVCGVLLENKMQPSIMVAETLNKISKQYVSYVGNPKLMNNVMANISIKLPVNMQEQKKISSVFKVLDNTINLNKDVYNEYLKLKCYFLQMMFI